MRNLWEAMWDFIILAGVLFIYLFFGLMALGVFHWLYHVLRLDDLTQWMLG
jgi:hypothetical protein